MMTGHVSAQERRRRIRRALAIIRKDRCQIVQFERSVHFVERSVHFIAGMQELTKHVELGKPKTKLEKKALDRLARALRRVEVALNDPHLEPFARNYFPILKIGRVHLHSEIGQLRAHCEAFAKKQLDPPKRSAEVKRLAAAEAARLLERHGLPVTVSKNGTFCRLAASLYGDEHSNLFHSCLVVKKDRTRV
jgi:hypothetical protein